MSEERKKPLWPWIVALLIGLPVLYVASFGPACWISSRAKLTGKWVITPYRPIIWLWVIGPEAVGDSVVWYSSIGATDDWGWTEHIDRSENTHELEWGPI